MDSVNFLWNESEINDTFLPIQCQLIGSWSTSKTWTGKKLKWTVQKN